MLCMLAFPRVGIFLLCTVLHALAFQSNRLILGHPSQSTRRVAGILPVHAPHNCDLFTPRLKDNHFPNSYRLTCRVCRSIALRSFDDSKASALFASSTSNVSDMERKRNSLLARLRWLLFWPLVGFRMTLLCRNGVEQMRSHSFLPFLFAANVGLKSNEAFGRSSQS